MQKFYCQDLRSVTDNCTIARLAGGFAERFVETGYLRGYGYVRGGVNGYISPRVKLTTRWENFRSALASLIVKDIVAAAKRLPSLSVNRARNGCISGYSYKGCSLVEFPESAAFND